jgi:hypothetical protein
MTKNILVSAIIFMFLLTGSGGFGGTEEKVTVSPPLGNTQPECSEDDPETSSCSAESPPLFDTSGNNVLISIPKNEAERKVDIGSPVGEVNR